MTYKFGRVGKRRNAATLSGMPAYYSPHDAGVQFGAAPMQAVCPDGTHLDTSGKCVKDDPVDPLEDTIVIRPKKKKSKRVPGRARKRPGARRRRRR